MASGDQAHLQGLSESSRDKAQDTFENDDDLRCLVCLHTLCEPRMLPCLHTMCTRCIDGLIEATTTTHKKVKLSNKPITPDGHVEISCPSCHSKTKVHAMHGSSSLPVNTLVQMALEERTTRASLQSPKTLFCGTCDDQSAAVMFCQECSKPVCDSCVRSHSKLVTVFRGHQLCSLEEYRSVQSIATKSTKPSLCLEEGHHSNPLDFHCNECSQLCCAVCIVHNHHKHNITTLTSISASLATEVRNIVQQAIDAERQLSSALEKLRASRAKYNESVAKAAEEIHDTFERIVCASRARESQLMEELKAMQSQMEKMFEAQEDSTECRAHGMRAVARVGNKALKMEQVGEQQRVAVLKHVQEAFRKTAGSDVTGGGDGIATSEVVEYECNGLEEVAVSLGNIGQLKNRKVSANESDPPMASFIQQRAVKAPCGLSRSAMSSDGRLMVAGCYDHSVRVWAVATGQEMATLEGHTQRVWGVAVSPNNQYIVSGSFDETVRVWAIGTWKQLAILNGHTNLVNDVAVSGDGSYDKTIGVWAAGTWLNITALEGHRAAVYAVAGSADGRRIVSGSHDNTVRVWTVRTWQQEACLNGHTGTVMGVAVSRDGRYIVSGSRDATVRVWAIDTRQQVALLVGHTDRVWGVAMSPDGRRDQTVRVWAVASWQQEALLEGHSSHVFGVDVSRDGRYIVSSSDDTSVCIWGSPTTH